MSHGESEFVISTFHNWRIKLNLPVALPQLAARGEVVAFQQALEFGEVHAAKMRASGGKSMSSNHDLQSKVATLTSVSSGLNSKIESLGSELQSLKRSLQTLSDNNQILNKSNHVLRQQQEDLNCALGSLMQELSAFKASDASENDKPKR